MAKLYFTDIYSMTRTLDLRSDTVTRPTPAMLEAMMKAPVGDDVFHEDHTIKALEAECASLFGMEEGLFCPSGTMCNQIAIKAHTRPMDEVICDHLSHIYYYETGGYAFNSGCSIKLIQGDRGRVTAEQVRASIQPDNDWLPISRLVVLENTCNKGGGTCYDYGEIDRIRAVCDEHGLALHLDGARIFNALTATGSSPKVLHDRFDSISVCLSKGLGSPIGSVLLGSKAFIKYARKIRKALGGGMRQVGYLGAAGLYALEHHIDRLKEDHDKANRIQSILSNQAYIDSVSPVSTNIVLADVVASYSVQSVLNHWKDKGLLAVPFGPQTIRLVTHLDLLEDDMILLEEILTSTPK